MAAQEPNSVHVFVSYSHNDRRWLDRLQIHLMPLMKDYELDLSDDAELDLVLGGEMKFATR